MSDCPFFAPTRLLILTTAAVLALAALTTPASASLLNWNNIAGGSASTAGNWSPTQIPAAADDLIFNLNNTYTVSFSAAAALSQSQNYRRGNVTLNITSPHTVSSGVTVGDLNGDIALMALTTGTHNSNAALIVGDASGSTGTLNVNDDDADLMILNSADMTVGNNGAGTLNVTGGGHVSVADQFFVGSNSTSVANLTVSGFVAQAPFPVSTLSVLGTNQSRLGVGGDATVSVSNGALASFAGDLVVANGSASTSTVTVQGPGLVVGARLNVSGDLLLGRNTSAGAAAGVATLNVNADGNVNVDDTLFVAGDPEGGSATLHMAAEGSIVTTSLDIGPGMTLDLDGGTLDIDGGTLVYTNTTIPLNIGGPQRPVLTLKNGATSNLPLLSGGRSLVVAGGSGSTLGDFDVRSGSDLTISGGGEVMIGDFADDDGSMIINGNGFTMTLLATSDLFVGRLGTGRFEAELEGAVTGQRMFIASEVGATGFALFENPGTTAQFNEVIVGGDLSAAGGDGTLVVNQNAVLTVTGAGIPVHVWPTGLLDITQGGQLNGSVQCDGEIELQGTAIMNGNLHLTGNLTGHPNIPGGPAVINGAVLSATGTTIRAIHGDLILGNPAITNSFSCALGNTIFTGANTITLHDADEAVVGSVVLEGGTLAAPNGIEIQNNGSIDGTGTIDGDVFYNSGGGVITATGANGITINGMLGNSSGNVDGTKFTFNGPDGGWTGAGAINARAVFNSGTQVNALANMSIGVNAPDGVTFNAGSELHANDEIVTLVDSNGLALGSLTDMDTGGLVECAQSLVVNSGRVLAGRGTVDAPTLTVFGTIRPGFASGVPTLTGDLMMIGNLTLGVNSNVDSQIAATGIGNFDRVIVAGSTSLNGTLHMRMLNGFSPPVGAGFGVFFSSSIAGTFASLDLERPGPGKNWKVLYQPTVVTLVVNTCVADTNHNGVVNVDDLLSVINGWGACPAPPALCGADIAPSGGNGVVNVDDLLMVINSWGLCP